MVDPLSFSAPDVSTGLGERSDVTRVGAELPVPAVDQATLPPRTDILAPVFSADLSLEDYYISWLPRNETEGLCSMTNSADLPEAFLLGDFQDLVGYEEDCTPESLPEVGLSEDDQGDPLFMVPIG